MFTFEDGKEETHERKETTGSNERDHCTKELNRPYKVEFVVCICITYANYVDGCCCGEKDAKVKEDKVH